MHRTGYLQLIIELSRLGRPMSEYKLVKLPGCNDPTRNLNDFPALAGRQQSANVFEVLKGNVLQGRSDPSKRRSDDPPDQRQALCGQQRDVHSKAVVFRNRMFV